MALAFLNRLISSTSAIFSSAHTRNIAQRSSSALTTSSTLNTFTNTNFPANSRFTQTTTIMSSSAGYDDTQYVTAFVTVPNEEVGNKIIQVVISTKLAACVNSIPGVKSSYWWKGKVETDQEIILMMKTRRSLIDKLNAKVSELHPYEVHEFIVNPIIAGHPEYLSWIGESTLKM